MRYKEHMKDKGHTPKCQWLAGLRQSSLHPHLEFLETVEGFYKAFSREEAWIKRMLQEGMPLTNSLPNRGTFAGKSPADWIKGTKLRYVRKTLGITRTEMIIKGNIPSNAYNRAEAGRYISREMAEKIFDDIFYSLATYRMHHLSPHNIAISSCHPPFCLYFSPKKHLEDAV